MIKTMLKDVMVVISSPVVTLNGGKFVRFFSRGERDVSYWRRWWMKYAQEMMLGIDSNLILVGGYCWGRVFHYFCLLGYCSIHSQLSRTESKNRYYFCFQFRNMKSLFLFVNNFSPWKILQSETINFFQNLSSL